MCKMLNKNMMFKLIIFYVFKSREKFAEKQKE